MITVIVMLLIVIMMMEGVIVVIALCMLFTSLFTRPRLCQHSSGEVDRACHSPRHLPASPKPCLKAPPDHGRGPPPPGAQGPHWVGGATSTGPAGLQLPASDLLAGARQRADAVQVRQLPVALREPGRAAEPHRPQLAGRLQLPRLLPQAARDAAAIRKPGLEGGQLRRAQGPPHCQHPQDQPGPSGELGRTPPPQERRPGRAGGGEGEEGGQPGADPGDSEGRSEEQRRAQVADGDQAAHSGAEERLLTLKCLYSCTDTSPLSEENTLGLSVRHELTSIIMHLIRESI